MSINIDYISITAGSILYTIVYLSFKTNYVSLHFLLTLCCAFSVNIRFHHFVILYIDSKVLKYLNKFKYYNIDMLCLREYVYIFFKVIYTHLGYYFVHV